MKLYLRILSYTLPYRAAYVAYAACVLVYVVFGTLNLAIVLPILDVLFNRFSEETLEAYLQLPPFRWSAAYLKDLFYHYLCAIIQEEGRLGAIRSLILLILSSVILSSTARYLSELLSTYIRTGAMTRIRKDFYLKMLHLPMSYFSEKRKGDLISRFSNDMQEIDHHAMATFKHLLKEPLFIIAYFLLMLSLSPFLTLLALIMVPVLALVVTHISRVLRKKSHHNQSILGEFNHLMEETIQNIFVIQAFVAEGHRLEKVKAQFKRYLHVNLSAAKRSESVMPISEILTVGILSLLLWIGGLLVLREKPLMEASEFITFVIVFSQMARPAKTLSSVLNQLQRGLASAERIFEITDAKSALRELPDAVAAPPFEKSIALSGISFAYLPSKPILKNIDLVIDKHEHVALVGSSGSGKTTLSTLLPRFYDPDEGHILMDGQDIRRYTLHSLRSQFGFVPQEAIFFNDSFLNNITLGREATEEEVFRATRIAFAHDFIVDTHEGYQTRVGDRGMKLSGGQKQRLNIARAILKNPAILILDEATSSLDSESEQMVQKALLGVYKERTCLTIAHRLSTIKHADRIVVMEKGRVVEQGTHKELVRQKGRYQTLLELQTFV